MTQRSLRSWWRDLGSFWVKSHWGTWDACSFPNLWADERTDKREINVLTCTRLSQSTLVTCRVAVQDSGHDDHFKGVGAFTHQHDPGCNDGNGAVAHDGLLPDEGAHRPLTAGAPWASTQHCVSRTHLPSTPQKNLTLTAPRNPPTANMDTMRDQITVTVCGGGSSSYRSYQLLLMKCWMNWRKNVMSQLWGFKRARTNNICNLRSGNYFIYLFITTLSIFFFRSNSTCALSHWQRGFSPVRENSVQWCDIQTESFLQFPEWWWETAPFHESEKTRETQKQDDSFK